jgi:hypothetical protein
MNENKEVSEKKVSWRFLIPFMAIFVVFCILGPVTTPMIPGAGGFANWNHISGTISCMIFIPILPTVLTFFLGLLREIGFFKSADKRAFGFLYVTTIWLLTIGSYAMWPLDDWYTNFLAARVREPETSHVWPSIIAPPADVVRPILTGGATVPWDALTPFIVWWWLMMATYAVFYLAIASLLRHHYIDVEKVPFPQTLVTITLANRFLETGVLGKSLVCLLYRYYSWTSLPSSTIPYGSLSVVSGHLWVEDEYMPSWNNLAYCRIGFSSTPWYGYAQ